MFNQPEFNVSATPVSKEIIQHFKSKARKYVRINAWVGLSLFFIVPYVTFRVGKFTAEYAVTQLTINPSESYTLAFAAAFITVFAFIAQISIFYYWSTYWIEAANRIETIDKCQAEQALDLTQKYPDLEAWRLVIVKTREITNGEFEMMENYDKMARNAKVNDEINRKQEESFRQLHVVK